MTPSPTLDEAAVQLPPPPSNAVRTAERRASPPRALGKVLALTLPIGALSRWAFAETPGLGFALWAVALVGGWALVAGKEGLQQAKAARSWAVAALFFAVMVAVRDSPALTFFNVAATLGFLALAARDVVAPVERTRLFDFPRGAMEAGVGALKGAASVTGEALRGAIVVRQRAPGEVGAVLRGLLLATPVLFILTTLLVAGDRHFSEALRGSTSSLPDLVLTATDWGFWSTALGLGVAGLWAYALRRRRDDAAPTSGEVKTPWKLGVTEALVVLGSVVVLFATFLSVQAAWLFSQDPSAPGTGLTYATWAREGFGELTIVAAITWWLVELSRKRVATPAAGHDLAVRVTGSLVLAQALVILVSAHQRLALYDEVYGFTVTRLFAHAGITFLGLGLLARLVTLWVAPNATAQLVVAAGIAVLAGMNVLNPDATVVRANLERPTDVVQVDWYYLSSLSADAAPAIEPLLSAVAQGSNELSLLRGWACRQRHSTGAAWNLGRAHAARLATQCEVPDEWADDARGY